METIIKKATEGGWKARGMPDAKLRKRLVNATEFYYEESHEAGFWMTDFEMVCDPLFWQALSKACGWEEEDKQSEEMWIRSGAFTKMPRGLYKGRQVGVKFFKIILAEGWEKAIDYLKDVCGISKTFRS